MVRRPLSRAAVVAVLAWAQATPSVGEERTRSVEEILGCAFAKRYDRELSQVIDVETFRDGRVIRRFRLQMASKVVDGRFRSLVYFLAPFEERGTRVLTIENEARRDEHFVFLPFLDRVKRVYGGRRRESFMGTDFSFEDLERIRVEELEAELIGPEEFRGETVDVASVRPRYASAYAHSEYRIARSDCSIVEIRHFKEGRPEPVKILSVPRDQMLLVDGEAMPTRATAWDLVANRRTDLRFSEIRLNPNLDERHFHPSALLGMSGIPGLSRSSRIGQTDSTRDLQDATSP
jgi:hypothetical protein